MKTNNRQQTLLIIAGAAIALLLGDSVVFTPLTRIWKERSATIADLRKQVNDGTQLLSREKTLRDRWALMQRNTLASSTSTAEQQVLKAVDRWAQDSRLSVSSIKPQWKIVDDDYTTLECRVDATGNLAAVTRFLYELEKDPLAVKVDTLELSTRDNSGDQLTLALQVSGLLLTPQN